MEKEVGKPPCCKHVTLRETSPCESPARCFHSKDSRVIRHRCLCAEGRGILPPKMSSVCELERYGWCKRCWDCKIKDLIVLLLYCLKRIINMHLDWVWVRIRNNNNNNVNGNCIDNINCCLKIYIRYTMEKKLSPYRRQTSMITKPCETCFRWGTHSRLFSW